MRLISIFFARQPIFSFFLLNKQKPFQIRFRIIVSFYGAPFLYQDDQVALPGDLPLVQAKSLPEVALHPIPKRGCSDLLFNDNSQPVKAFFIAPDENDDVLRGQPFPIFHHTSEILRLEDPFLLWKTERLLHGCLGSHPLLSGVRGHHTVSFFLPFNLLRFKTLRPAFVLILSINPCVLFRLTLLGWYVLFMIDLVGNFPFIEIPKL